MKTNYPGHDQVYRDRRGRGDSGWDSPDQVLKTIDQLERLLADVTFPAGAMMLEFGCGAGELTLHFAHKGLAAYGVDISPTAVNWARQRARRQHLEATFFVGDVTGELSLPVQPVHLLLDGHCLHCLIGPDRAGFFRNARKYLRPDGVLCIDTMCGDPHYLPPGQTFDRQSRCIMYKDIATRHLGLPGAILQEITDAGFSIIAHTLIPAAEEKDQDALLALARPPAQHSP